MTTTPEAFADRLNAAARRIGLFTDPILTRFGDIVIDRIEEEAPKRTRAKPGGGMVQTSPGVLESPPGSYLVGELRGTSQRSPKSRTFLTDSFDAISGPLAVVVADVALSLVADEVVKRPRRV